jgi:beta-glucosidase
MHLRRRFLILVVVLTGYGLAGGQPADSPAAGTRPWMNPSLAPGQRAQLLVEQMTLDEKILQIHMINTREHPREVAPIPRLGIPALKITNGPAGAGPGDTPTAQPATALPAALALAASWDRTLAETFGRIAGAESAARGERVLEAPGVNIVRVPQNGRNFEYFGEDPYLAEEMGVYEIRGIQNQKVIAETKHYAANNQEQDRKTINEIIDERSLREIYLPAFEAAVKQGDTGAIMCAYPSVNGQFGCENTHLLKDILRGEWGFKGFVQSDYTATHSTIPAALAGLDLEMKHDNYYDSGMKEAVTSGQLSQSVLDDMLVRRFREMFRFGVFDQSPPSEPISMKQDGALARSIAEQSAVLLKNDRLLPLDPKTLHSIALIGPYALAAHTGGGGSSRVLPAYTVTPEDGLKNHLSPAVKITLNDGKDVAAAAALAADADLAIVMVGNRDSEGRDRPNLSLPENQDKLVAKVAAANGRTVVVLKTGGPVLMPWLERVPAILEAWYPGEEDGNVVSDLLFGTANPSGKLPITFPKAEADTPAHTPDEYPGINGTVQYSEGLKVGYRWYDAASIAPLFPFGYGLSYTRFELRNFEAPAELKLGQQISVSLEVANLGSRAGADIVQVYVADPPAVGEPPRQLRGFAKVELQPHESAHLTVALDPRAFSIWNTEKNQWAVLPGTYEIFAGDSCRELPLHSKIVVRSATLGQ